MAQFKKFLRMPAFDEHLALHRADCLASHRNLATYEFVRQKAGDARRPTAGLQNGP